MKFLRNKLPASQILDFIIYGIILIYTLIYLIKTVSILYDYYILESSSQILVNHMNPSVSTSTSDSNSTLVTRDDTWNQVIRSLFIYGSGVARYQLVRNGTPAQKAFCLCSTIALDAAGNVVANLINDPNYVRANIQNWKIFQPAPADKGNIPGEYEVDITADAETFKMIKKEEQVLPDKNSFLPEDYIEDSDIKKSNIIDTEWFEELDIIKKLALTMLIFNSVIISSIISIIFIYYGDYLLNKYNLEKKFPSLARVIKLRKKFTKYYFILSCTLIAISLLFEVSMSLIILSY